MSKIDFSVYLVTNQYYLSPYLLFVYFLSASNCSYFLSQSHGTVLRLRMLSLSAPITLFNKRFYSKYCSIFSIIWSQKWLMSQTWLKKTLKVWLILGDNKLSKYCIMNLEFHLITRKKKKKFYFYLRRYSQERVNY